MSRPGRRAPLGSSDRTVERLSSQGMTGEPGPGAPASDGQLIEDLQSFLGEWLVPDDHVSARGAAYAVEEPAAVTVFTIRRVY